MLRRFPIAAFFVLATFISTGCNTEQLWVPNHKTQTQSAGKNAPEDGEIPDIQIVDAQEVDLVENLLTHRVMYRRMLVALRDYYRETGYYNKRQWAEAELADLDRVKPFKYILSAEIPTNALRPQHAIVEADKMYDRGISLMKKGGHGLPALYRQDLMREALDTFTEMITKYPSSDKIDDAAYCCGEILKEYFDDQELLAVRWYQRARDWDPKTLHPALFQAAVVYDFRLHDRAKALELYHRVLEEEPFNKSNTAFSSRRVYELTEGMKQLQSPRRPLDESPAARPMALTGNAEQPAKNAEGADVEGEDDSKSDVGGDKENSGSPDGDMVPVVELGDDEATPDE